MFGPTDAAKTSISCKLGDLAYLCVTLSANFVTFTIKIFSPLNSITYTKHKIHRKKLRSGLSPFFSLVCLLAKWKIRGVVQRRKTASKHYSIVTWRCDVTVHSFKDHFNGHSDVYGSPEHLGSTILGLPLHGLDTRSIPKEHQFQAMSEATKHIGILGRTDSSRDFFNGFVGVVTLPNASILRHGSTHDCSLNRTKAIASQEKCDLLSIQYRLSGNEQMTDASGTRSFGTGEVVIKDMSLPFQLENDAYEAIALLVSKKALFDRQIMADNLHGVTIGNSAICEIFKNYLISVWRALPQLEAKEAEKISEVSIDLLHAALLAAKTPDIIDSADFNAPALTAVRACIEDNLHETHLTPEFIAKSVAVSTARLYRLCKPYGSPMELVRFRRMRRAKELMAAGICTSVNEVSFAVGYQNRETFSRAFKKEFGISPKEFTRGR